MVAPVTGQDEVRGELALGGGARRSPRTRPGASRDSSTNAFVSSAERCAASVSSSGSQCATTGLERLERHPERPLLAVGGVGVASRPRRADRRRRGSRARRGARRWPAASNVAPGSGQRCVHLLGERVRLLATAGRGRPGGRRSPASPPWRSSPGSARSPSRKSIPIPTPPATPRPGCSSRGSYPRMAKTRDVGLGRDAVPDGDDDPRATRGGQRVEAGVGAASSGVRPSSSGMGSSPSPSRHTYRTASS